MLAYLSYDANDKNVFNNNERQITLLNLHNAECFEVVWENIESTTQNTMCYGIVIIIKHYKTQIEFLLYSFKAIWRIFSKQYPAVLQSEHAKPDHNFPTLHPLIE